MNEPQGYGFVVSWGDPTDPDSLHPVDWLTRHRRLPGGEVFWRSQATGEEFPWGEIVRLAEKTSTPLMVWHKIRADACVLDGGSGVDCPGCRNDRDGVLQDLRPHWRS